MLSIYQNDVQKLDDPIIWEVVTDEKTDKIIQDRPILDYTNTDQEQSKQTSKTRSFTVVTFGECGQGKSTALSAIAEIYHKNYDPEGQSIEFAHAKSFESVTGCVESAKIGSGILYDTPGFNDTNTQRSEKKIWNELTKLIRPRLRDES